MEDLKSKLEKLLAEAEDCGLIAKLALDEKKRSDFRRLSEQFHAMALDVKAMIAAKQAQSDDM